MPSGVYIRTKKMKIGKFKRTPEMLKKLSESHRGQHSSPKTEFKKGRIPWIKGKKLPKLSRENSATWKGGKYIDKNGYIMIYKPAHPFCSSNGYIREHRLVIEKQIGRYLTPKEIVHHLRTKDDNRPQVLMAFINQSIHVKFESNPQGIKPSEIIFDGRLIPLLLHTL